MKKNVAIYIGRFQPLHKGHEGVIEYCKANYDEVIVLIGSANKRRSVKNPFPVELVQKWIESRGVIAETINDYIYSDDQWALQIVDLIENGFSYNKANTNLTIVGHDKDASTFYLEYLAAYGFKVETLPAFSNGLNATDIREILYIKDVNYDLTNSLSHEVYTDIVSYQATQAWKNILDENVYFEKEKAKYKDYPYKETLNLLCADAVVRWRDKVLLIKRKNNPGKGCYALPGGFVNTYETSRTAAFRELEEETGLSLDSIYCYAEKVFDAPNRGQGIPRTTIAYYFKVPFNVDLQVRAGDDAEAAVWVPESELKNIILHDDHADIIQYAIGKNNG